MCNQTIEMELEKIFMEQKCFDKDYILALKEKFSSNTKQLKRLILARFMQHISNNRTLVLFDEDIFDIYKTIIDNYIIFLNKIENIDFQFNKDILKNLSGIASVLKSQVSFFYDNKKIDVNPIHIEKKTIIANCIDNIYIRIDNIINDSFDNIEIKDIKDIKEYFIKETSKNIIYSYKSNLIDCFNFINDTEKRKELKYFNDVLEEEREILASIIKLQIKPLERLCKDDDEKNKIEMLLKPIIEAYQQTGKSFDILTEQIKTIDTNININFGIDNKEIEKAISNILKDIDKPEDLYKQKTYKVFEDYLLHLKKGIMFNQKENINKAKNNIENYLNLSEHIKEMFNMLSKYINDNKKFYKEKDLYNIIDGIYESISIKVDNIKEKEEEVFSNKDKIYNDIDNILDDIKNYKIEYNFDEIYEILKDNFNIENINSYINTKNIFSSLEKILNPYIKKVDDFIKNTILFEISTFQEIIYYSVVRLRESKDLKIIALTKYIDDLENNIENILIENNILLIKPHPHDMFNAKEHEVLLAEKNEDFLKGQIIKVVNYGYKKKDEGVIKRATIIAAK